MKHAFTRPVAVVIAMFAIAGFASLPARAEVSCEGTSGESVAAERLASRIAYDALEAGILRLQRLEEGDIFAQGLAPWQVRGIRAHMLALARQGNRLYDRYDVNRSSHQGHATRYYLQVRRANIAWESRFDAAWRRLSVPASHPMRAYFDEVFRSMRRSSYALMRHAACVPEEITMSAVASDPDSSDAADAPMTEDAAPELAAGPSEELPAESAR